MTTFFEIAGELIACELDETERVYGRAPPSTVSSFIRESSSSGHVAPNGRRSEDSPKASEKSFTTKVVRQSFGTGMVRTGLAILAVPDPLPFIDEAIGAVLVVGGSLLILTNL
jgi:hypothetical protein